MAKTLDEMELRALLGIDAEPSPTASPYTVNARYLSSLDGFDIKRPPIPPHVFLAERARALSAPSSTSLITLDLSRTLNINFPATTPLILSRYARIAAGDTLTTEFRASTELYYVIAGTGRTSFGAAGRETLQWDPGDVFCLPGGGVTRHRAGSEAAVLWVTTNEPQLALEGCAPPAPAEGPIQAAHYPGSEIRRQLLAVYLDSRAASMPGKSVNLGNAALEVSRTTTPSFTLAMNSLLPGEAQRAHRHNAVAVTLVVAGERCYSMIDGERVDWTRHAVMITPPGTLHSHHNSGNEVALFLIVQDGGLYYHCRTMGFSFT